MEARLKSCCVGLLEVNATKLEFIQRSAKDFLEDPSLWKALVSEFNYGFDANIPLMKASLLQLKKSSIECAGFADQAIEGDNSSSTGVKGGAAIRFQGPEGSGSAPDPVDFWDFWELVHSALEYAYRCGKSCGGALVQLLDELDRTATHHWLSIIESTSFKERHQYRYTSPHLAAADIDQTVTRKITKGRTLRETKLSRSRD
jgi:hypothetical protein